MIIARIISPHAPRNPPLTPSLILYTRLAAMLLRFPQYNRGRSPIFSYVSKLVVSQKSYLFHQMCCEVTVHNSFLASGIHQPEFRLPRASRNAIDLDKQHVPQHHCTLSNLPSTIVVRVESPRILFSAGQQNPRIDIAVDRSPR